MWTHNVKLEGYLLEPMQSGCYNSYGIILYTHFLAHRLRVVQTLKKNKLRELDDDE